MAEVKWIKIVTNIFDDEKIRYIESLPNGDETIVIWFRILCLAGKSNSGGLLMMTDRIAYTEEMLSSIFQRDRKSIQLALNIFESLEMIEMIENKIYLTNWGKHQSLDLLEKKKIYDREYQKQKRAEKLLTNNDKSYDSRTTVVENRILDIELELEEDKEKDKEKNKRTSHFVPPSLEELQSFISEQGYNVNAETFISHYETVGWKVGKNKMKDWKAAVRGWHSRNKDKVPKQPREQELPEWWEENKKIELESSERENLLKKLKGEQK